MKRVLVVAGHRNANGGGCDIEARENGERVKALMELYRQRGGANALGFELRTTTPDDGLGWSGLGLAQAFASGFQQGWIPDFACELNTDSQQGGHMVYPDWGADRDTDLIKHGRVFAEELKTVTGMPIGLGNSGLLSEKGTAVGGSGFRLGIFAATERFREVSTRCIFEQGAHGVPAMRELMTRPDFPAKAADAFLRAMERWFDLTSPGWKREQAPRGYTKPELPGAIADLELSWGEIIDGAETFRILGVVWEYERKRMRARREARCWSSPSLTKQTRKPLEVGETITVVLKGKIDGKLHRVTPYGSIIRSSSLEAI